MVQDNWNQSVEYSIGGQFSNVYHNFSCVDGNTENEKDRNEKPEGELKCLRED